MTLTAAASPEVPAAVRAAGFDPARSAGLFVGISRFDDPLFASVAYAVDDAVGRLAPARTAEGSVCAALRQPARLFALAGRRTVLRSAVMNMRTVIDELASIYRALDEYLRAAGSGSISRALRAAGASHNYLSDLRARLEAGRLRGYDLGILLPLLRALCLDRRLFFLRVFGRLDPVEELELETRRLAAPPAYIVGVRDLLLAEGWQPPPELPAAIRQLDAHRYRDAAQAASFARGDLEKLAAGLCPRSWGVPLLAVYGSARRLGFSDPTALDEAQQALMAGLEVARRSGDPATVGDFLQRLGYVLADRGEHRRALDLAALAQGCYVRIHDLNAIGRTLVDQGIWLNHLGRTEESIAVRKAALGYLVGEEEQTRRNRFSALQGLGLSSLYSGALETAREYAREAAKDVEGLGSCYLGWLRWLEGKIAVAQERYGEAEESLREAMEIFTPISSVEAALASTEFVRVLFLQNRHQEAYEHAAGMARFIDPLEEQSTIAAAAVVDLILCGQRCQGLDGPLLDRVSEVLEKDEVPPEEGTSSTA